MSVTPINPAMLLDAFGGFSESRYLGLFRSINRDELADMLRALNATEIHFDGNAALALDVILAPLDTGMFPREALELVAENTYAVDDLEDQITPLMRAYCASLSLYANMASEANALCSAERAARALAATSKVMGALWGLELLKFYLWCFTLRSAKSADGSPAICLAFSFLLLCDLFASAAAQLAREVAVHACGAVDSSLAEQSINAEFLRALRQEFEAALGPTGKVPAAINQAMVAALGKG